VAPQLQPHPDVLCWGHWSSGMVGMMVAVFSASDDGT
jgi:hypothetical protein